MGINMERNDMNENTAFPAEWEEKRQMDAGNHTRVVIYAWSSGSSKYFSSLNVYAGSVSFGINLNSTELRQLAALMIEQADAIDARTHAPEEAA